MCPLCIGTATIIASSATSAGGLAALVLRLHGRRSQPTTEIGFGRLKRLLGRRGREG